MNSAPNPTLIQWLLDGSDPAAGYCRICGQFAVPPDEVCWRSSVCNLSCLDELFWRVSLSSAGQRYRRPTPEEEGGLEWSRRITPNRPG